MSRDVMARLLSNVAENHRGCWIWQKSLNDSGYGRVSVANEDRLAHRIMYQIVHGELAAGMTVDHLCFEPACINPDHLRSLPNLENARHHLASYKESCVNGHAYTPENTAVMKRAPGRASRRCRTCDAQRAAARRARQKAQAAGGCDCDDRSAA